MHRARVGARHHEDVAVRPCIHRGANLHARLLARDHLLAAGVPAFFRADLILDHDAGGAGTRIFRDRALDVERVAVAGVAVSYDWQRARCRTAAAQSLEHFRK